MCIDMSVCRDWEVKQKSGFLTSWSITFPISFPQPRGRLRIELDAD
jgi:hypothetical protein